MKKILLIITLLLFLIPTRVDAMGTDKYYVDVTINEDGSPTFKEFIIFDGSYNYLERKLVFKGNVEDFIGNTKDDFLGTNIYNASGITNICTSSLSKSLANNFEYTKVTPTCFSKVAYASNGDAKVSVEDITNSYANIRIYNPSTKNEAFYLEYTILI